MPPTEKPLPPDVGNWLERQHPGHAATLKEAQYVLSDAWNGTVYLFELQRRGIIPKSVSSLPVYVFALDQSDQSLDWTWCFQGPETPSAKSAVLKALRERR